MLAAPAHAGGKLVSWSFDPAQNRLSFRTAAGVQPRAQFIPNPSRIVMDLPGTVAGSSLNSRDFGGAVRQVRVGQFDAQTTRLVIELAPGYEVDPQSVRVRGASSTQWSVQLPAPRLASRSSVAERSPRPILAPATAAPEIARSPVASSQGALSRLGSTATNASGPLQVTRSGILLRLPGGAPEEVEVSRSQDRSEIEIALPGAVLPTQWVGLAQRVGKYGLGTVEFLAPEKKQPARLRLRVNPDSPDWRAVVARSGDLILVPRGGISAAAGFTSPSGSGDTAIASSPPPRRVPAAGPSRESREPIVRVPRTEAAPRPESAAAETATVNSVVVVDNNRLIVRGDRPLETTNPIWDPGTRSYWVLVRDAVLSPSLRGPQLSGNGPIRQVRLLQRDARTVAIAATVDAGARAEDFSRLDRGQILALEINPRPRSTFELPRDLNLGGRRAVAQTPTVPVVPPASRVPKSATLVTIDPGHGGKDPGAIGIGGLREKDVVLDISRHLQQILAEQGLRVLMTRSDDRFISLQGRVNAANRSNSDIFVSVHANAISLSRPDVNGVETFYARGSSQGQALASSIQRSVLQKFRMRNRGVKRSGFFVLKHTDMPAALVEVGFVTGREDAPKLRDPAFRRQMAEAIADGILNYVRQNPRTR